MSDTRNLNEKIDIAKITLAGLLLEKDPARLTQVETELIFFLTADPAVGKIINEGEGAKKEENVHPFNRNQKASNNI